MPDARGLDKNFHDLTIVDMDDERELTVTPADMTRLRELWPSEIFNHMRWFQQLPLFSGPHTSGAGSVVGEGYTS